MILTFLGNVKKMSTKDLIEVYKTNNLNNINKNEIFMELRNRNKKQNHIFFNKETELREAIV